MAHRDGVLEFHHAVGNHETQAGRQLGSEELLLREPQRSWASREGVALVHVLPVERNGSPRGQAGRRSFVSNSGVGQQWSWSLDGDEARSRVSGSHNTQIVIVSRGGARRERIACRSVFPVSVTIITLYSAKGTERNIYMYQYM